MVIICAENEPTKRRVKVWFEPSLNFCFSMVDLFFRTRSGRPFPAPRCATACSDPDVSAGGG